MSEMLPVFRTFEVMASTPEALATVRDVEAFMLKQPQAEIATRHVIHAGVYSRTVLIPAGTALTGALIKVATTLTICGHVSAFAGDGERTEIEGYCVVPAQAGRKQVFFAHRDTWLTMAFRTNARTVEEAEREFTDEHDALMSRHGTNDVVITGD